MKDKETEFIIHAYCTAIIIVVSVVLMLSQLIRYWWR